VYLSRGARAVQQMRVAAVGLLVQAGQPVLLLQETGGQGRVLPLWVGIPEAQAIELERGHIPTPRPTTHRLILDVVGACGGRLDKVRIRMVDDAVLDAEIVLGGGAHIPARVSDAVALALHEGVPIECDDAVLEQAGVRGVEVVDQRSGGADDEFAEEVERFARMLDDVSPDDFDTG
jgi:bifunctional DNase/RNase